MFLPTLRGQTTDEQKKLFLEPALKHEIIGCYAQTEVSLSSSKQKLNFNVYVLCSWGTDLTFRASKQPQHT